MRKMLSGLAAGAAGTAILNVTTYGDMLLRGRPPSDLPTKTAKRMAQAAHLPLQREGEPAQKKEYRAQGMGALLGYVSGLGIGAGYALLRDRIPDKVAPVAPLAVGAAATVAGSLPMVAMGLTDPREWGVKGWIMDLVPHMAYGLVTVGAFEAMRAKAETPRSLRRPTKRLIQPTR